MDDASSTTFPDSPDGEVPRADLDGVWKLTAPRFLRRLLELFFPAIAADIDWTQEPVFLDKELEQIVRDANLGQLRADILVLVRRRDGSTSIVNLHAEVQSQPDKDLNLRMFRYWKRLSDILPEPVASVALLGYLEPGPPVGHHAEEIWGCRSDFHFSICRLSDPPGGRAALESATNPVALVALAHVRALETRGDMALRAEEKWRLIRRLYACGLDRQDVLDLYHLIDRLLALPKEKELAFNQRAVEYEKENDMTFISSAERIGQERGEQIGEERGRVAWANVACRLARKLFLMLLEEEEKAVRALPAEALMELADALLDFKGREDFLRWLAAHPPAPGVKADAAHGLGEPSRQDDSRPTISGDAS